LMKTVFAMVGSFGSGCSYIAGKILVERHGFHPMKPVCKQDRISWNKGSSVL